MLIRSILNFKFNKNLIHFKPILNYNSYSNNLTTFSNFTLTSNSNLTSTFFIRNFAKPSKEEKTETSKSETSKTDAAKTDTKSKSGTDEEEVEEFTTKKIENDGIKPRIKKAARIVDENTRIKNFKIEEILPKYKEQLLAIKEEDIPAYFEEGLVRAYLKFIKPKTLYDKKVERRKKIKQENYERANGKID
eukprot:TRINITY_DN953_c0_g4_i1.p1 TRINITY_DN953_c0_g4~~TRINITY_DN953_c0_g4_i1.p1  ORF type:complete len:218 (+),score=100.38 TRINITY_DN953_c0_g4_i1:84-656(+)